MATFVDRVSRILGREARYMHASKDEDSGVVSIRFRSDIAYGLAETMAIRGIPCAWRVVDATYVIAADKDLLLLKMLTSAVRRYHRGDIMLRGHYIRLCGDGDACDPPIAARRRLDRAEGFGDKTAYRGLYFEAAVKPFGGHVWIDIEVDAPRPVVPPNFQSIPNAYRIVVVDAEHTLAAMPSDATIRLVAGAVQAFDLDDGSPLLTTPAALRTYAEFCHIAKNL